MEPENNEVLEGGKGDDKSLNDIAVKHNVPIDQIQTEFEKGIKVEAEHTSDPKVAEEVAKDHLTEDPLYYEKLAKMEATPTAEPTKPESALNIEEIVAKAVASAVEKVVAQFSIKQQEDLAKRDAEINAQKLKHDAELKEKEQQIEELKRTAPTGVPNQQVQFGSIEENAVEKAHKIAQGYREGYGLNHRR